VLGKLPHEECPRGDLDTAKWEPSHQRPSRWGRGAVRAASWSWSERSAAVGQDRPVRPWGPLPRRGARVPKVPRVFVSDARPGMGTCRARSLDCASPFRQQDRLMAVRDPVHPSPGFTRCAATGRRGHRFAVRQRPGVQLRRFETQARLRDQPAEAAVLVPSAPMTQRLAEVGGPGATERCVEMAAPTMGVLTSIYEEKR
jgi:hypothetical protein